MNSDCARDSEMLKVRFQYILLKPMIGVFEDINQVERSEEKKLSENQEKIGKLERFNKSKR